MHFRQSPDYSAFAGLTVSAHNQYSNFRASRRVIIRVCLTPVNGLAPLCRSPGPRTLRLRPRTAMTFEPDKEGTWFFFASWAKRFYSSLSSRPRLTARATSATPGQGLLLASVSTYLKTYSPSSAADLEGFFLANGPAWIWNGIVAPLLWMPLSLLLAAPAPCSSWLDTGNRRRGSSAIKRASFSGVSRVCGKRALTPAKQNSQQWFPVARQGAAKTKDHKRTLAGEPAAAPVR